MGRQVFRAPSPDGRRRDIFPLPNLAGMLDLTRRPCRSVTRRLCKKAKVRDRANLAIDALNSLFFGGKNRGQYRTVQDLSDARVCQRDCLLNIIEAVHHLGPPPSTASGSGALKVLRAASSTYLMAEPGVGDTVPMSLPLLSLPDGRVAGVDLLECIDDPLRGIVSNFEDTLLQDQDVWTALSSNSDFLQPYNDPALENRKFFLKFVKRLYDCGILSFTNNVRCRVGAFSVSKKPKEVDGVRVQRQRLILDCRATNMMFKAPPHTELGSLSSLSELELQRDQTLYCSGADIKDCFYAVRLPEGMCDFFCLGQDLTRAEMMGIFGEDTDLITNSSMTPCITVLPMGFSWSFYLVQKLHEQVSLNSLQIPRSCLILDGQPAPRISHGRDLTMPYCDNVHVLSTEQESCTHGMQKVVEELQSIGFAIHEEEEGTAHYFTLGGMIDGVRGEVALTPERTWSLILAFEHITRHPVDPDTMQRLLGHAMVLCTICRSGMSCFRRLYDFVQTGGPPRWLSEVERRECLNFIGIVPLLVAKLRRTWSETVFATDASPDGYGICERPLGLSSVRQIGGWNERWRFKQLPPEEWAPRTRALHRDPLVDHVTVTGVSLEEDIFNRYQRNEAFPEVDPEVMEPGDWKTVLMGRWGNTSEHITIKEGRALVLLYRRLCRAGHNRAKRHLVFVDNLGLAFAVSKGRASSYALLRVLQQLSALSLAGDFAVRLRWVPSEYNPSDGPSRGQVLPGAFKGQPFDDSSGREQKQSHCAQAGHCKGWRQAQSRREVRSRRGEAAHKVEGSSEEECSSEAETGSQEDGAACSSSRRERRGKPSASKRSDSSGTEKCELRDSGPIHKVPPAVHEFLQGKHNRVKRPRDHRCSAGRLHGCHVRGGKKRGRRGENGCSSGVHGCETERKIDQMSQGIERMEKGDASKKQAATTSHPGLRNRNGVAGQRQEANESQSLARPRHIYETRREPCLEIPGHCGTSARRRAKLSGSMHSDQRSGMGPTRQSWRVRQHTSHGLKGKRIHWGANAGSSSSTNQWRLSHLPVHGEGVQGALQGGRRSSGRPSPPSVPAQARGSSGRSERPRETLCGGESTRQVASRHQCETIHEGRETSTASRPIVAFGHGVLSLVSATHGEGAQGPSPTTESLGELGWEDVLSMPKIPSSFVLEVFAGTARITQAFRDLGFSAYPIDICIHPSHDVLNREVGHKIVHLLQSRRVRFLWLGMPCTSFSQARKNDGLGPGPLRDPDNLHGLPNLSRRDQQKVNTGNALLVFTIYLMSVCESLHIPYALENPSSSFAWKMPELVKFSNRHSPTHILLHYCQFGEPHKKPTSILGNFWNLQPLAKLCATQQGISP